jgi:hypothetical protein
MGTSLGLDLGAQRTGTRERAGATSIGQAEYADTNVANRAALAATNRQAINSGNQEAKFNQGRTLGADVSGRYQTLGENRQQGQQAARNYWQSQNQFQGTQKNAAAGQQISGAQTSLSGMGQAGNLALNTETGRRTKTLDLGPFKMTF